MGLAPGDALNPIIAAIAAIIVAFVVVIAIGYGYTFFG
jgi:hypothetical protein